MNYFNLLKLVRPYKKLVFLNLVFSVLTVVFSLVSLVMIVPFLQLIFDKMPMILERPSFSFSANYFNQLFYYFLSEQIRQEGKAAALVLFCFQVITVFFIKNLFRYASNYVLAPVKNGVVRDLRQSLYAKLMNLPLSFFNKTPKGDIITKMTSDLSVIEFGIMCTLETIIVSPLTIILYLLYMFLSSPLLTSFVLIMVIIVAVFVGRIGKSLKRDSVQGQSILSEVTSIIDETISGIKVIFGFNAQRRFKENFRKKNQEYYSVFNRMYRKKDLSSPLTEFLSIIIVCLILWFGGSLALGLIDMGEANRINPETFIAFMVVFSQLIGPAKSFSNAFYEIQKGMAGYQRIHSILSFENPIKEDGQPIILNGFENLIEFRNVGFHYDKGQEILNQISFKIEKGKTVALVGSSGAGKSTIVDLLPRFYDCTKGEILIDGINIQKYSIESLRAQIGIVTQEAILFNQSIEQNIAISQSDIDDREVDSVLTAANATEFVNNGNRGKNSFAGERGNIFSGGERQRLTIARALYKNPPILILDEATSALDSQNEKLVQDAILKVMKGRTSIIIAHRLTTIQNADEIMVVEAGNIVERGTHNELMNRAGYYKRLVDMQQFKGQ